MLKNSHRLSDKRLPSAEEMRSYDENTISQGLSASELMERAGLAVFREIANNFSSKFPLVLCGPGNNGGDGLIIGRHLLKIAKKTAIVLIGGNSYSREVVNAANELIKAGGEIFFLKNEKTENPPFQHKIATLNQIEKAFETCDLAIDALLGSGSKGNPYGVVSDIINLISQKATNRFPIISVDIPSGVNPDTGEVSPKTVTADRTISIEFAKRGLFQYPARAYCGEIINVTIGINPNRESEFSVLDSKILNALKDRDFNTHKGDFGHLLIIAGSISMPGAGVLVAQGALRSGVGLITKAHLNRSNISIPPEVMLFNAGEGDIFTNTSLKELLSDLDKFSAVVFGPGVGIAPESRQLLIELLKKTKDKEIPVLLDADALTILSESWSYSPLDLRHCVITPHPGEASKLISVSAKEIQKNRFEAVKKISDLTNCTVVLKGAGTLIYEWDKGFVNTSGNPFMATAGSGDVLSGIIGGMLAQGYSLMDSAALGVYLHGAAGDFAVIARKGGPIIASDIAQALPYVMVKNEV